jgi:hypothetical protein
MYLRGRFSERESNGPGWFPARYAGPVRAVKAHVWVDPELDRLLAQARSLDQEAAVVIALEAVIVVTLETVTEPLG